MQTPPFQSSIGSLRICALLVLLAQAPTAYAAVYKCAAKDGSTTYSDMPCEQNAQVIQVTPEPLHTTAASSTKQPAVAATAPPQTANTPLTPAMIAAAQEKSAREITASICSMKAFNEWIKAQGHPLPEPSIRMAKMTEIGNQCRRPLGLSDMIPHAPIVAPAPILHGAAGAAAAANLAEIVKSGSIERLQKYLSTPGVDINDRPGTDEALLDYAAEQNQASIARFLLGHGARVDATQNEGPNAGYTALHRAAIADAADVAQLLLASGAEVNFYGPLGVTPLILAASNGSRRSVEVLLDHGADVATPNGHRETALSEATAHNHGDIARMLLIHLPVPTRVNMNAVAMRGDLEALRLMVRHDELAHDVSPQTKNEALRFTILGGPGQLEERKQMITLLLADGADIDNQQPGLDVIPLMLSPTPEMAEFLFAQGANKKAKLTGAQLARWFVCNNSGKDPAATLQVVVAHGIDIGGTTPNGDSALPCAAYAHNEALVAFLQAHQAGAGRSSENAPGSTPGSTTAAAQEAQPDGTGMHCAVSQFVRWIRVQNPPPTEAEKKQKLLEIDGNCGTSLHTANVITAPVAPQAAMAVPVQAAPTAPVVEPASKPSQSSVLTPDGWPVPPVKHLAAIKALPQHDQIILEVRDKVTIGVPNEIGVFNLTAHSEMRWDILGNALRDVPARQFGAYADWAPSGQLLYATQNSVHLVSRDGSTVKLHLNMPGGLKPLDGMTAYALSPKAQQVAYMLNTRDWSDRQQDKQGKLYKDLMIQGTEGSAPVSIWRDGFVIRPSWRPDGAAIAHTDSDSNLVLSNLAGKTLWSFHPGPPAKSGSTADYIQEIRWDPSGKRLAFLMGSPVPKIYLVNADGTGTKAVEFHNLLGMDRGLSIRNFAWSPDGQQFAFRAEADSKCNYAALSYKFETGNFPCIYSRNLFTVNLDGSHLTKVTPTPDFDSGELFWIQ